MIPALVSRPKPHRHVRTSRKSDRRGGIVVLTAVLLIVLVGVAAFSVDLGYLCLVRTELQRTVDSAALAGAGAMYKPIESIELLEYSSPYQIDDARTEARRFGVLNGAARYVEGRSQDDLQIDLNAANRPAGDIVVGKFGNGQMAATLVNPNAVQVQILMSDQGANGAVPLFFGGVLGKDSANVSAVATAKIIGYPVLMPIVTALSHWEADNGPDEYSYSNGSVVKQGDGVREIVVYPGKWNGEDLPPGNFGAVDIGTDNGTAVLRSQIDQGPSAGDFDYYGGALSEGMELSGSTGVNADIETAFTGGKADGRTYDGVIGQVRFMPIYDTASGTGTNATFRIVKFVAVRIMDADLKSKNKRVVVQRVDDEQDLATRIHLCQ